MPSKFAKGDKVVRKNKMDQVGVITSDPKPFGPRYSYSVHFDSSSSSTTVLESDLLPAPINADIPTLLTSGQFGNKLTFSRLLTYERLQTPLLDNVYSLRASRTDFQAYQFKPLLKFLRSGSQRLLIADEVGLGKTIEAGFILTELIARHPHTFRRALIVCKASLCFKWQQELRKRFDLNFTICKTSQLREFHRQFLEDPETPLQAICSFESFRSPGLAALWDGQTPPLDILIIDEAHYLKNPSTRSHRACRIAAEGSDAVLALTATPIQIGSDDLFHLLNLLDPLEFASPSYFNACLAINSHIVQAERLVSQSSPDRFQKALALLEQLQLGQLPGGEPSPTSTKQFIASCFLEPAFDSLRRNPLLQPTLNLLSSASPDDLRATVNIQRNLSEINFLSRIFNRTRRKDVYQNTLREATTIKVQFTPAEMNLYKAVVNYVRDRFQKSGKSSTLLFGLMMPQRQLASCIPAMVDYYAQTLNIAPGELFEETTDIESESDPAEAFPSADAQGALATIIQQWYRADQPDSKFAALAECLRQLARSQPSEQIVIFSYFKKTLDYLSTRLSDLGFTNTIISGNFSAEERENRIAAFRNGTYQVLLSTEVGSEGLDFQFAHILINYDLPWNPMVVEQRIGRLDRFGQKSDKVQIFNLTVSGTIEDRILAQLYNRVEIFKSFVGDLEAILGSTINELVPSLFDPDLTEEQINKRIEEAGLLLEKRKKDYEEWASATPQIVGHDAYYDQEMERVQALGRYIRPEDLATFFREFLIGYDDKSSLRDDPSTPGAYLLKVADIFRAFIQQQPDDPQKCDFLKFGTDPIRLTFDPQVAQNHPLLPYIHVRHFLVRAVLRKYTAQARFHPVARLELRAKAGLPLGRYLYLIARATVHAARPQDLLLPVILNLETGTPLSEDQSEKCLAHLITDGATADFAAPPAESLQSLYDDAEYLAHSRLQDRRTEIELLNQAFIDARCSSLEQSYNTRIANKQKTLEDLRNKPSAKPILPMYESQIQKLITERDSRLEKLRELASVTAEHRVFAAGLLWIH